MQLVLVPNNPANLFDTKIAPVFFLLPYKRQYICVPTNFDSICSRNLNTETATYLDELLKEQISL